MKKKLTKLIGLSSILCVASCGTMDRSYLAEMNRDSDNFFNAGKDFPIMSGDSGTPYRSKQEIKARTPASKRQLGLQKEEMSLKEELAMKEETMNEMEMETYKNDSKYLPSESDKLYYLSLSERDRGEYIRTKKEEYNQDHGEGKDLVKARSVHAQEIYVGMSKDDVTKLWGRPLKIQIAGNPKYQNELWIFNEDGSYKNVYFEGGVVNGWALDL